MRSFVRQAILLTRQFLPANLLHKNLWTPFPAHMSRLLQFPSWWTIATVDIIRTWSSLGATAQLPLCGCGYEEPYAKILTCVSICRVQAGLKNVSICINVCKYKILYILDRRLGAGGFPEADMCDSRGGFIQYQSPLLWKLKLENRRKHVTIRKQSCQKAQQQNQPVPAKQIWLHHCSWLFGP